MDKPLTITNERVIKFYNTHPHISFEHTCIMMVEFMEKMVQDTLSTSMVSQLVDNLRTIEGQIRIVSDSVSKNQEDILLKMNLKLMEMKREYIDDVKIIMGSNITERISPLLKEQEEHLIAKTNVLLNDILPKTHESVTLKIHDTIKELQRCIQEDTQKLTTNPDSFKEILMSLDHKFTSALTTTQIALSTTSDKLEYGFRELRTTQEQQHGNIKELNQMNQTNVREILDKNIIELRQYNEQQFSEVREIASLNQESVNELLKKMEGSSTKGRVSENILSSILQKLYPSGTINFVGTTKESGDFMLEREDKPKILIENKNWDKNVIQEEVKKFIRDIDFNKCCGLFLSQNTGVANKQNYEINIHDGNVLLYIHYVNNDPEKIKIGIEIIDHFKHKLDQLSSTDEVDSISKEVLNDINKEYNVFASQKLIILKTIKDFQQTMTKQLETMSFPSLKEYLSDRYGESMSNETCNFCGRPFKNFAALKAHQRGCDKKKENDLQLENIIIDKTIEISIPENIVIETPQYNLMSLSKIKEECKKRNINTSGKKRDELIKMLN